MIENDIRFLQDLGPVNAASLNSGIRPRIESLFRRTARRISDGKMKLDSIRPVLEFMARSYAPAWILLADLQEEVDPFTSFEIRAEYVRRYLEAIPDGADSRAAWERLAHLYRRSGDVVGACGAFVRAFDVPDAPLSEISNMANWLNNERGEIASMDAVDRASVFGSLASLMERRLDEASATDLSRLAWLHLHADDSRRALQIAELGLARDQENIHCQRLIERLNS